MAMLLEIKAQPVALGRIFCFGGESVRKLYPCVMTVGLGQCKGNIRQSSSSLSHPLLLPQSVWDQGELGHFSPLLFLPLPPLIFHCIPVTWPYDASWAHSLCEVKCERWSYEGRLGLC